MSPGSKDKRVLLNVSIILLLILFATFFVSAILSVRRAQRLRDDVCSLRLDESSFMEVSKISGHYRGWVVSHDDAQASCSPEGCTYEMSVENPITKSLAFMPRTALFARLTIRDNKLKGRSLMIAQQTGHQERAVFIEQTADPKLTREWQIVSASKISRVGIEVSQGSSILFKQLANSLRLSCLLQVVDCAQPEKVLPFLAQRVPQP